MLLESNRYALRGQNQCFRMRCVMLLMMSFQHKAAKKVVTPLQDATTNWYFDDFDSSLK